MDRFFVISAFSFSVALSCRFPDASFHLCRANSGYLKSPSLPYSRLCVSSMITAYIIDKFAETHRISAFLLTVSALAVALMSFIDSLLQQYVLWCVVGAAAGLIEVAAPVFAFRAFTRDAAKKWFVLLMAAGSCKMLTPLVIQLSISLSGDYSYGLYIVSLPGLICAVLMLLLPTPRHDKLRGIKKSIDEVDSLRSAMSVRMVRFTLRMGE